MTRTCHVVLVALALPTALAAQSATSAVTAAVRTTATRFTGWLTAAFDSIPANEYRYKPTPAQQSVGYVAQHLEFSAYKLCERFGQLTVSAAFADSSVADTVKARWPKDTLTARLKAAFVYCDRAMASVTDAQLADQLPGGRPGSGQTLSRALYLVTYATDLADHYSQIANYMRLNGLLPPSATRRPAR